MSPQLFKPTARGQASCRPHSQRCELTGPPKSRPEGQGAPKDAGAGINKKLGGPKEIEKSSNANNKRLLKYIKDRKSA